MTTSTIMEQLTAHLAQKECLRPDGTLLEGEYKFLNVWWEVHNGGKVFFRDQNYLGDMGYFPNNLEVIAQMVEVISVFIAEKQTAMKKAKSALVKIREGLNKVKTLDELEAELAADGWVRIIDTPAHLRQYNRYTHLLTITPDQSEGVDLIATIELSGTFQPDNETKTMSKRVSISPGFCKTGQWNFRRIVKALDYALTSGCLE